MKTLAIIAAGIILFPVTMALTIILPAICPAEYEKAKRGEL